MESIEKIKNSFDPVLIVEDSKTNQVFLQALCDEMGIETEIADNGQIALEMIENRKYSIYLVDLMMPVMDGKTFIKILRGKNPNSIILIQTALDSSRTIIDIMKLGVFDYIIKPIDKDQFQYSIKKGLEFKRLRDLEQNQVSKFQAELAKIRQIQVSLLPDFTRLTGYDIGFSILPAEDLSGDFLDGYFIDENTYQIVLCDVTGHGISSSYIGIEIRSIFRTLSSTKLKPSSMIKKVNQQMIYGSSKTYFFATVVVCQIDLQSGAIIYASGGHLPSLLYKSSENKCIEINGKGSLIGILRDSDYENVEINMDKGDSFLLYTDGIIEAYGEDVRKMYDKERLEKSFIESIDTNSVDIVHSIVDSVYSFTNYTEQEDDITILCIKKI